MKKSEQKQLLVKKLEQLHNELNVEKLYVSPSHKTVRDWIAKTAAVLKNLDEGDYQEFVRLSRTITPTEPNRNKRKSAAYEIDALIRRKVAEYKIYDFSYMDKENPGRKIKKYLSDKILPTSEKTKTISTKANLIGPEKTSDKITISRESKEPVLQVKEIAEEIAKIIINLKSRDGIIGVFGKWGRGKTYLMEQIWNLLNVEEKHTFYRVNFQAWLYQDTPACWAYLYEKFAEAYLGNSWRLVKILRLNYNRVGLWPLLNILLILIPGIIWKFIPILQKIQILWFVISLLGIGLTINLIYVYLTSKDRAIDLISTYSSRYSLNSQLGYQAEIQKELVQLLKTWISDKGKKNKKVVLFVEDIDRCCEEKIMQVIDALRVMLENPEIRDRVIVLAAIDQQVLIRAILWKYKDIFKDKNDEDELNNLVIEYMDKLFILGINLCQLSANERKEIFETYTPIIENINSRVINGNKISKTNFKVKSRFIFNYHDKFQEINEIEKQVFSLQFDLQTDLLDTPREINIVYYQYLLARNLLIKLGVFSFKEKNLNYSLILELILLFKKHRKAEESSQKILMHAIDRKIESEFNEEKKRRQIKEIIELVVAY